MFSRILSELPQLFNPIELYHTTENKDTWKRAHIPKNIYRKRKGLTTHLDGVLILGKDSSPEYLIELLGIKKLLVKKGYKEAKLLKSIKDISNQSLSQKLRLWGIAY
ncbi:MAG: hypothetical protein WCF03_17520 [Nitrososphaeraceae archaeon]